MSVTETQLTQLQSIARHKGFVLERAADGLTVSRNGTVRTVTTAREAYRIMRRTNEERREIFFRLYGVAP